MAAEDFPRPSDASTPVITQNVASIFAVFGLVASLSMGWMVARAGAGLPPLPFIRPPATAASTEATALKLVATDLKFDNTELHLAGPGATTVQLQNAGLLEHDLTIEGTRLRLFAKPGQTTDATLKIDKPGTYAYFCSLPGHREAGMSGKLIVENGAAAPSSAVRTTAKATPAPAAAHASHASTAATQKDGNQPLPFVMEGTVKVFALTARAVQWEVLPGVFEEAWVYNDQLPGPVIRVTEGEAVRVDVTNALPEDTVIHFHGPRIPNAMDGVSDVTQPAIKRGERFSYEFTAEPSGTFVYHTHHNAASQEPKGLYGVLIVDPKPGSAEAQRDAQYAHDYLQVVSEFGSYFTVNGKAFPATPVLEAKTGEKVRLRLINLGQALHPMHLHGHHFKIVGTDGYAVEGPPLVKDTVIVGPGERYDLEFVADNPGAWLFHCHILSHVANQGVEPGGMITVLKVS
jgi:FtsP/CotA-like multicopper oxidase with cupredoxin domain